jgi:hypothetical protein
LAKDYLVAAARAPGNSRTNAATGAVFPGRADVFVFELDPETKFPTFQFAIDPPGSCSDEITPVNKRKTQFLIAHLCQAGNPGWSGGAVSIIDISSKLSANWVLNPPAVPATGTASYVQGTPVYNPHSGDYDKNYGYVATNFVVPGTRRYGISLSHFAANGLYVGEITYPGDAAAGLPTWADSTNTVFDAVVPSSGAAFMDVKYIDADGNLVTCASLQGRLYHVNVKNNPPTVRMALDIAAVVNNGERVFSGETIRVIPGANRLVVTYGLRYVVLIAWDENYNFEVKDSFDTCTILPCTAAAASTGALTGSYSGAHYVKFSDDYETVFVSSYYQSYPATKRVLAFTLDAEFNTLELETGIDRGTTALLAPHNPHAIAYKRWSRNSD